MAKIKQLTDKHGEILYPVSKEAAIFDENGVLLSNKISTFITRLVDNLANYYLKSEIYTKEEIDTLIGAIQGFSYIVVSELPIASAFTMGKIYLVPSADPQTQNTKDEYITIRSGSIGSYTYSWEQIGSTAIDLSGYVTTEALNTELTKYTTTANLTTLLAAKQDTIADLSTIRSGASAGATAYQKPASGIPASDIASGVIPTVPTISTDVSADAASDVKTSSPKSVKTYVDAGIATVESNLADLADEVEAIDVGAYVVSWDGNSEPVVANIPAGVSVTYNSTTYTGTLAASASTKQKIYLVATGTTDNYDRYVTVGDSTYSWVNIGTTEITLADYATKSEAAELEAKVDDISTINIEGKDKEIFIVDDNNVELAHIGEDGADFKNLKSNGEEVLTESYKNTLDGELSDIDDELSDISEKVENISNGGMAGGKESIVFANEKRQYTEINFDITGEEESVDFTDENGNILAKINKDGITAINRDNDNNERLEGLADFQRPVCDINLFGVYGQSLSTGQQDCPELSRVNYKGNLMIGEYEWVAGSADVQPGATFVPLVARSINQLGQDYIPYGTADQTNGETASINSCNAAKNLLDRYVLNMVDRKFLAASFGVGGISIELLSKGCPNNNGAYYTKLEGAVNVIKASADAASKSICCTAIAWMQGEWNEDSHEDMGWMDGTPSTHDKNDYKAYLIGGTTSGGVTVNGMVNDLCDTFKTKFGQENNPIILGTQMSEWYIGYRSLPIMMAQLEASNESKKYLVCTPTYRVTDRKGHLDSNGERWIGEFYAKVWYKKVILGVDWKPLQPKKIRKYDKFIVIDFYVPEPPLVFDTLQVRAVDNYGFKVFDANGEKTITSVNIISPTQVRIDVSSNFSGDTEITYAGQVSRYGNLRDSDPWISFEKYKNLDTVVENPAGVSYHPEFEPKDKDGNVIYNKNYPCQNFCLNFYYKVVDGENTIIINI